MFQKCISICDEYTGCPKTVTGYIHLLLTNVVLSISRWHVTEYTTCSKSCGGGTKTRQLYCSKLDGTGKRVTVVDTECSGDKPEDVELSATCNVVACPAYYVYGEWTQVIYRL